MIRRFVDSNRESSDDAGMEKDKWVLCATEHDI